MPRNFEIKARVAELEPLRARALALGARAAGLLRQVDVYFAIDGARREKLREIDGRRFEWIRYDRPEKSGVRGSDYAVECLAPDDPRLAALRARPVVCRVDKQRELLLWENVRIHLDEVARLGRFLELEAVVDDEHDEARCRAAIDHWLDAFGVEPTALLRASYSDLLGD